MNIMETEDGNVLVSIPICFQTVCGRRRLVVVGQGEVNDIDLDESGTLIRLFARAREWTRLLESGAFADVKELAEGLKMDRPYVVRVLRLANLSPKILRAVIAKELPDDFSTERLFNIKSDLWSEQERERETSHSRSTSSNSSCGMVFRPCRFCLVCICTHSRHKVLFAPKIGL